MKDVLILCYHAVSDDWPSKYAVTRTQLEEQLGYLAARGYRGATFHDAVHSPPASRTLAVTFDDAYRSVLDLAAPILSRFGIPATVFVTTGFADGVTPMTMGALDRWIGGPYEQELLPMSWEELDSLAATGWEIGSHSRTHPRLTEVDDLVLAEELQGSRGDCAARLSAPCRSLAYPWGDEDDRVVRAAGEAGYSAAAAHPHPLLHAPEPMRWPRIGIQRGDRDAQFRRKVSPLRRRLHRHRAWSVVQAGHRVLRRPAGEPPPPTPSA